MVENTRQNNQQINLLDYGISLWTRKWLLLGIVFLAMLAALINSKTSPKFYRSDAVIMAVASESGGLGMSISSSPLAGMLGSSTVQTATDKIMVFLRSRTVAEAVIRKFDLMIIFNLDRWDTQKKNWKDPSKKPLMTDTIRTLMNSLTKISKNKEGIITISVEWQDPALAAEIANYFVFALTEVLKEKAMNITVQTIDRAVPAEIKSRPRTVVSMILAGLISTFFCSFAILIYDHIKEFQSTL